jgi:hypothetical protein
MKKEQKNGQKTSPAANNLNIGRLKCKKPVYMPFNRLTVFSRGL